MEIGPHSLVVDMEIQAFVDNVGGFDSKDKNAVIRRQGYEEPILFPGRIGSFFECRFGADRIKINGVQAEPDKLFIGLQVGKVEGKGDPQAAGGEVVNGQQTHGAAKQSEAGEARTIDFSSSLPIN